MITLRHALLAATALLTAGAVQAAPLTLAETTALPGYTGDFDHFAIDGAHGHLILAGEEHHELDIFSLKTGAIVQRIEGYGAPHSPLVLEGRGEVLIVDGEKPSPVLDTASLKAKRSYTLPAGADSIGFDTSTGHVWIVTGGKDVPQADSNLIEVDPVSGKTIKSVHFDADHVEAMAVEQHGHRDCSSTSPTRTIWPSSTKRPARSSGSGRSRRRSRTRRSPWTRRPTACSS